MTYNYAPGYRAHGYQVWRNGQLASEHIGGASERRSTFSINGSTILYGTAGEVPTPDSSPGWNEWRYWPAIN